MVNKSPITDFGFYASMLLEVMNSLYNLITLVTSLSTIVLNSRDWSEIVWLPEISRFKINLTIGLIRKKTCWNTLVRL